MNFKEKTIYGKVRTGNGGKLKLVFNGVMFIQAIRAKFDRSAPKTELHLHTATSGHWLIAKPIAGQVRVTQEWEAEKGKELLIIAGDYLELKMPSEQAKAGCWLEIDVIMRDDEEH